MRARGESKSVPVCRPRLSDDGPRGEAVLSGGHRERAAGTALLSDTDMTYPNLTHHGGATGVTASCHRLQLAADRALLVDCSLFQGQDAELSTPPVGAGLARERAAGAGMACGVHGESVA